MQQAHEDSKVNGEYFIQLDKLQKKFDYHIEMLAFTVEQFWQSFTKNDLDIQSTLDKGNSMAEHTRSLHHFFTLLDSHKLQKDLHNYF